MYLLVHLSFKRDINEKSDIEHYGTDKNGASFDRQKMFSILLLFIDAFYAKVSL